MKRQYMRALCAACASAALACAKDPTASLRGAPSVLSLTPTVSFVDPGKTVSLVVIARDEQLNPVPVAITATSANPGTATVEVDTARHFPDGATQAFVVTGVTLGQTTVTVVGGGLSGTVTVNVLPTAFNGSLSSTTPKGGDTLTIRGTTLLKFNPAHVKVTFEGPEAGTVVFANADSVKVLVPFSSAGVLTIAGIVTTFIPGLEVTLPTIASVTQTGDFWAGDGSWQTAPNITALLPAAGTSSKMISRPGPANGPVCPEGSPGPCTFFRFTLADTATLIFTTDWEGAALDPDVDIYLCSDSTVANFGSACGSTAEGGFGGATASKPQTVPSHKYAAGTHWFVIENYDKSPTKNYRTTISRP